MPSSSPKPLPAHLQALVDLLPLNEWVHRSILEKFYRKQEVKRRLRKIKAEYGWDIRSERRAAGANDDWYMRCSDGPIRPQMIRKEVRPADRIKVYERDAWKCRMCGCDVALEQHLTNPKVDHKVPAERGGTTVSGNLQTLCNQCNLKKRQACKLCTLPTCAHCPYAFPEEFSGTVVVKLSTLEAEKLQAMAKNKGIPPATLMEQLIRDA